MARLENRNKQYADGGNAMNKTGASIAGVILAAGAGLSWVALAVYVLVQIMP